MTAKKALIIGAGIAGPAVAMALQRAGIESVVYEGQGRPDEDGGAFLNVASNGLDVLKTLDAHAPVVAEAFRMPRMVMWNGNGKRLGEVANGVELPDGTVSVCVKRRALQRTLADEATGRGIEIVHGKRLTSYEHAQGPAVTARFSDGTQAAGDLLVGADGIHSPTRRILDPASPEPTYTGLISVGGFAHSSTIEPTPGTQHLVFGKRAFFGYLVTSSREIYWFANDERAAEPSQRELADIPAAEWKRRLRDVFAEDIGIVAQIIEQTDTEINAVPIHDIPTAPTWSRGPAALVGDAAHATSPSSGQGASLALEDALVLAKCLRDIPETGRAFEAYERLRRQRAERIVAYSRKRGNNKAAGPVARRFRDLAMPFVLRHFASAEAHAWVYDYHIDWETTVA